MRVPFAACALIALAGCARRESQVALPGQTATVSLAAAMAEARQQLPEAEARRVWADDDADASGAPSPDGKQLSYTDWSTLSLGVFDIESGKKRILVRGSGSSFPETSVFSTDGKRLAYRWIIGTQHDLRVVDVAGSEPRVIVPSSPTITSIYPKEWTSDDREILVGVFRPDQTFQIAFASVATGELRIVKTFNWDDAGAGSAALSRDGRYLAVSIPTGTAPKAESDIVILTRDGAREVSRLTSPGFESVIGWTTDGRLFFQTGRTASVDGNSGPLYAVQMRDGRAVGEPQLVKSDMSRVIYPRITPDGQFFYGGLAGSYDVYVAGLDVANARVLSPAQRASHRLIGFNQGIDWTADGRSAAYLVREGAVPRSRSVLAIRDQESGDVREVRPNLDYINPAIRWSPDAQSILVQGNDSKGRHGLFTLDPHTGKATPVVHAVPGGVMHRPQWSPDGRAIYYSVFDQTQPDFRITRRDVATGSERQIFTAPKLSAFFALSEDGSTLAVTTGFDQGSVISVVPSTGGAARELLRVPPPHRVSAMTWSRDGKHLLFAKLHPLEMTGELWRVPVAGGPAEYTGLTMKNMTGLRVHPDGRRVGFTGGEARMEVWMMPTTVSASRAVGGDR